MFSLEPSVLSIVQSLPICARGAGLLSYLIIPVYLAFPTNIHFNQHAAQRVLTQKSWRAAAVAQVRPKRKSASQHRSHPQNRGWLERATNVTVSYGAFFIPLLLLLQVNCVCTAGEQRPLSTAWSCTQQENLYGCQSVAACAQLSRHHKTGPLFFVRCFCGAGQ